MRSLLTIFILGFFLVGCDLESLKNNPNQAQEIAERLTTKKEELLETYETLEIKIGSIQEDLEAKREAGLEKVAEVQTQLEAAQKAFEETKEALEQLSEAGQTLSDTLSGNEAVTK